jgi:hypothetical protein
MNIKNQLAFFTLFVLLTFPVKSQNRVTSVSDTAGLFPLDTIFSILEKKHDIKFYYENGMPAVKKLPLNLSDIPLDEALIKLTQILKCTYVTIDTTSYILMPLEKPENLEVGDKGLLIIGDPYKYGKYRTATLTGILVDSKSGNPLIGARAYIKKLDIAKMTDRNGKFIMNLPVGEHELEFSYFAYEPNSQKIKLVSNGSAEFQIIEKTIMMDEVIIRGERARSNISRVQMSLLRLDTKSITELPLSMGEKDILRSMSLMPGIQSVGEFGSGFNVRGGSSDQNLILLEDAPLFNSSHLFGLESVINPDGVSGLSLLKGGIPAQYGERASSVTNISLGDNPQKMKVKGGIGLLSSRLNIESPVFNKSCDLLVGGRSSYSNWLLHRIPDADLMNSSASFYDLNALLNIKINSKNRLTFFAYFSRDKFTYSRTNNYNYGSTLGTLRWSHIFNEKLSSKLLTSYSHYDYSFIQYDNLLPANAYQISSSIKYNSLKYNMSWNLNENYSFDFGLNSMLYRSMPGDKEPFGSFSKTLPVAVNREKGIEAAAYISASLNMTKNISSEIGLRNSVFALLGPGTVFIYSADQSRSLSSITGATNYGNNSVIKRFSGLEPRLSFRYTLSEYSSVKLSFNRINQYINLISNTSVAIPSDIWKLSSPFINPLVADQFSMGYYRNFKNNSIETSIELYYKSLKNIVEYKNSSQLLLNQNAEINLLEASGHNYGVELFIKKNSGLITGWISYTLSRSLRHTSGSIIEDQINGNRYFPSNYDKPDNLNIIVNYNLTRRWHLSGSFSYSTGRPVTLPESKFQYLTDLLVIYSARNKYRLPDYHRLDISVSCDESLRIKKKWKGSWTLSVINVYGRKNPYSTFYRKEEPGPSNNYRAYNLYTLYIIGRPLPTLTYNFTF